MACPGAAGLAVLARAYYADGFYPSGTRVSEDGFAASAALTKATLINSAVSMANADPIPSDDQGWGRILLDEALYFAGDTRRLYADDHADGFTGPGDPPVEYAVEVESSDEPLEVTLVWTDYPSTPAASVHLLNDLDLVVEGPAGTLRGNVFSGGASVPGGEPDRRNTVEAVRVASPPLGAYTVTVSAAAVPWGPQPYALVITGAMTASTGPRPRYRAHTVDDASPGGNGDGVLDPGETAVLPVTLRNGGGETATSVGAVLTTDRSEVLKVYRRSAAWPDLAPGEEAASLSPHYEVTLEPVATCGEVLPGHLAISGDGFAVESGFDLEVGQTREDYPSLDTPLAIPKKTAGIVSKIDVPDSFTLAEVDVTVDITHGDVGQLRVLLRSPSGTEVTLHRQSGAGTADIHTTYDEETPPDGPGAMSDFAGEDAAGDWSLEVADLKAGPLKPGTLEGWTLHLRATAPFRCNPRDCVEPVPPGLGPTLLLAKSGGADLVLTWAAVSGAADYHVWGETGPAFTAPVFTGASGGATTFTDPGALSRLETRFYQVRAVNACRWEGP
jgi:subtilisin-like proprotein convertase family protein